MQLMHFKRAKSQFRCIVGFKFIYFIISYV